jgi:hypothetical protein
MSIFKAVQKLEENFWNKFIQYMSSEGIIMKTLQKTKRIVYPQRRNILLLIFIWAAIGFVSGMLIGRLCVLLQLI